MSLIDFNSAPTQRDDFELIPDGTKVPVQITVRPGHAGDGGWLKRSKAGDCLMIDAEFVIVDGPFAKRKFWSQLTVDGETEGQKKAVEISVARLRGILESAFGVRPDDESDKAMAKRRISSYGDIDGLRFWAVVGIEKGKDGYKDKNNIKTVLTPDRSDWQQLEQVKTAGGNHAVVAAQQTAKVSGARPSWA